MSVINGYTFQEWIIAQYESDGDLELDFADYAALQDPEQGILINSTDTNIAVADTVIPAVNTQ